LTPEFLYKTAGYKKTLLKIFEITLFVAMVIWYSGYTYKRNNVWKDGVSIWSDAVNKSPSKARPHFALNPDFAIARSNLSITYNKKGMIKESVPIILISPNK